MKIIFTPAMTDIIDLTELPILSGIRTGLYVTFVGTPKRAVVQMRILQGGREFVCSAEITPANARVLAGELIKIGNK